MTYRQHYTEDPEGQWQGYKDIVQDRAWGLDGWARRTTQGAFFDWVTGNSMLPAQYKMEKQVATAGQTVFTLNTVIYQLGGNELEVLIQRHACCGGYLYRDKCSHSTV